MYLIFGSGHVKIMAHQDRDYVFGRRGMFGSTKN